MAVRDVQQLHGAYHAAVRSGNCHYAHTAAAGADHNASIGTAATWALENGYKSGVVASILHIALGYVSGTLGAGFVSVVSGEQQDARITTGTAIVSRNALVGNRNRSKCFPFTTATVVAGDPVRVCFNISAQLATTAAMAANVSDKVDGAIALVDGVRLGLEATAGAAGTTPLVVFSVLWEEDPV